MKRIEFKKLSKDIISEGITIELLEKVQDSGKFSPAMFQAGDDPVTLIKANNLFFWVQLPDGSFLKDKRNLMTFDVKSCIIARARYWTLFSDVETSMDNSRKAAAKEKEINEEVKRITADVKNEAEEVIKKYREIESMAGVSKPDVFYSILKDLNPAMFEFKEKNAIQFITDNPTFKGYVELLETRLKSEDYDSLYMSLKTDGLPLLASLSNDNLGILKQFFAPEKIVSTIELIKGQSHIKNVAMFNVNQRYL